MGNHELLPQCHIINYAIATSSGYGSNDAQGRDVRQPETMQELTKLQINGESENYKAGLEGTCWSRVGVLHKLNGWQFSIWRVNRYCRTSLLTCTCSSSFTGRGILGILIRSLLETWKCSNPKSAPISVDGVRKRLLQAEEGDSMGGNGGHISRGYINGMQH